MDGGTLAYRLAGVHALRGEPDLALAQLEKAVAAGLTDQASTFSPAEVSPVAFSSASPAVKP